MSKQKSKLEEGDVAVFATKAEFAKAMEAAMEAGIEIDPDSTKDFSYHPALKFVGGKLRSDKGTTGNKLTPEEFLTRITGE